MKSTILRPAIIAIAALGLAGCNSYDHGYGYSRVSLGYTNYGSPYYGWYDGYYYPGTGIYIYDRYGSRHRWSNRYRDYWIARRPSGRFRDNWSGYRAERREYRRDRRDDWREYRQDRREDRREFRRERREDRRDWRRDRRRG